MFSFPSHQRPYHLCSSLDPALTFPEVPSVADDAPQEELEARDKAALERQHAYAHACNTGNWPIKPGQKPTMFRFAPIHGTALTWLQAKQSELKGDLLWETAFRLAIRGVENFGPHEFQFAAIDGYALSTHMVLATTESLEPLYSIGRDAGQPMLGRSIVLELGMVVFLRAVRGLSPLSSGG